MQQVMTFKIDGQFVNINICSCMKNEKMSGKYLKAVVACFHYMHLPEEKKSKGLVPIIRSLKLFEKDVDVAESVDDQGEASIEGWVPKRLMKSYIDCCKKLSEEPNMRLLINLYNLEVSEDEVTVSDCGLQDVSISPFLDALKEHKSLAALDLSHNLLGNNTMEKIKLIFNHSNQRYGGLTLDLHSNQFGPTALFQICECNVLLSRLEVLNLSENRLTDACGSYLATILLNCKSLYSVNLEQTSITSRTIQKIADALPDESPLSQLLVGRNSPVSGTAVVNLLARLSSLKRFSELSLRGMKMNKPVLDGVCRLVRSSNLTALDLGESNIRSDGAIRLIDALEVGSGELVKLDLSCCGLVPPDLETICKNRSILCSVTDLNLSGNSFGREASGELGRMIADHRCCIRVLYLDKCRLGFSGIVHILEAASESESLEEIYLADNVDGDQPPEDQSIENLPQTSTRNDSAAGSPTTMNLPTTSTRGDLATGSHKSENLAQNSTRSDPAAGSPTTDNLHQTSTVSHSTCGSEKIDNLPDTSTRSDLAFTSRIIEDLPETSRQGDLASGSRTIEDLSAAIAAASQLHVLDLSRNKFSEEVVEELYRHWRFPPQRVGVARMHVEGRTGGIVRFFLEGKTCCYLKPCCRRDWP